MQKEYRNYLKLVGLEINGLGERRRIKVAVGLVESCTCKRILDAGCFDGRVTRLFLDFVPEVYGLDLIPEAVKLARKRGIKASVLNFDKSKFPFPNGYFDCVFSSEVIEHVLDPDRFLEEINRVLKSSGHLVLTTPNLARLNNRLALLFGRYPKYLEYRFRGGSHHLHLFTSPTLKKTLEDHNFVVEEFSSNQVVLPIKLFSSDYITSNILSKVLPSLGDILIVKARKIR